MAVEIRTHDSFVSTTTGLRRDIPPMILFERGKQLGVWDPAEIDFTQDAEDWKGLNQAQKDYCLQLTSNFIAGEEAVTLDLLPMIKTVSEQGHFEEAMYLTTFLFEEAKHVDFFARALDAFGVAPNECEKYHNRSYRALFYDQFPRVMNALYDDPSPENLIRASATYNLGIEGILAETGYYSYYCLMDENNILPGTREGIRKLQIDESRHIAYGIFLVSRLLAEDDSLFSIVQEVMDGMMKFTIDNQERAIKKSIEIPFDFDYAQVRAFAQKQFDRRMATIEKARGKTLEEIYGSGSTLIDDGGE